MSSAARAILLLISLISFFGSIPVSAQTGYHEVLQYDPDLGNYVSQGCIQAITTSLSASAWYGYDSVQANPASGVVQVAAAAQVLLLDASDGLHLVYLLDGPGSAAGGQAELAWSLTGAPADWVVQDDGASDSFTGTLGSGSFTASHSWVVAKADGGVLGPLGGSWSATGMFTDVDGTPGNELTGLTTLAALSADGNDLALVLAQNRPLRIRLGCGPRYRVSQWNPSTSDFQTLGCVQAYPTNLSAADYYAYDSIDNNLPSDGPGLAGDRAHMFLIASGVDGLCLGYVLDTSPDGTGGAAEMQFTVPTDFFGNPEGSLGDWLVQDDGATDSFFGTAGDTLFEATQSWTGFKSDGGVLGPITGSWTVDVQFTDVNGTPGNELSGLTSWAFASASGANIPFTLALDLPIRIDPLCLQGCETPPGMAAWWSFDEAAPASIARETAFGNDAAHSNIVLVDPPTPTLGYVANGLRFDSPGEVALAPDDPSLDLGTDDFTIDAWVFLDPAMIASAPAQAIVGKGMIDVLQPLEDAYSFILLRNGSSFEMLLEMRADGLIYETASVGAFIPPGAWTHVAVTVDRASNVTTFYDDGLPVGSTVTVGSVPTVDMDSAEDTWIGLDIWGLGPTSTIFQLFGVLDELELFHRVLTPLEVRGIAEFGKCKESAEVPWMRTVCPTWTSSKTSVTICNDGVAPTTYRWFLTGIPASAAQACDTDGPDDYDLPSGGVFETVTIAAGDCQTFEVTMHHPGLVDGSLSCYQVVVENVASGHVFTSKGLLQSTLNVVKPLVDPHGWVMSIPGAGPIVVEIPVDDTGAAGEVLAWSVVVAKPDPGVIDDPDPNGDPGDPGDPPAPILVPVFVTGPPGGSVSGLSGSVASASTGRLGARGPLTPETPQVDVKDFLELETSVVSLDGLPPGMATSGTLVIPPGGSAQVTVQVEYLEHIPFQIYDLLLLADLDGDGEQEVIASVPMRSVLP